MTRSEQLYLDRLRAIRAPKRANIGLNAGAASATAGAPITADQGPLPDGSNLGQQPMPNRQSGIVPGRNRMSIGNSARGNIDLGSFLSARPNQDAVNQLAQNPLAQVDPYKATTGVGGFFRRLFGDDANERNEAAASQRGQMLAQKWLIDQQTQGKMGLLDKEHQYAMERAQAASKLNNEETQYRTQLGLQGKQLENQWALQQEAEKARQARAARFDELTGIVGDPIKASMLQERMLTAPLALQEAQAADERAAAEGTGRYAPKVEPVKPERWRSEGGFLFKGDSDPFAVEDGQLIPLGMAKPPMDINAVNEQTTKMKQAKEHQNTLAELNAEPTVMGGLKALGGEAVQGALNLGKDAFNTTFPNVSTGLQTAKEMYNPVANYLKEKARLEQDRQRKIYESQNPQLFQ